MELFGKRGGGGVSPSLWRMAQGKPDPKGLSVLRPVHGTRTVASPGGGNPCLLQRPSQRGGRTSPSSKAAKKIPIQTSLGEVLLKGRDLPGGDRSRAPPDRKGRELTRKRRKGGKRPSSFFLWGKPIPQKDAAWGEKPCGGEPTSPLQESGSQFFRGEREKSPFMARRGKKPGGVEGGLPVPKKNEGPLGLGPCQPKKSSMTKRGPSNYSLKKTLSFAEKSDVSCR